MSPNSETIVVHMGGAVKGQVGSFDPTGKKNALLVH